MNETEKEIAVEIREGLQMLIGVATDLDMNEDDVDKFQEEFIYKIYSELENEYAGIYIGDSDCDDIICEVETIANEIRNQVRHPGILELDKLLTKQHDFYWRKAIQYKFATDTQGIHFESMALDYCELIDAILATYCNI